MNNINFVKDITRIGYSLTDVRLWYKGESEELKRLLGAGFFNHLFVVDNQSVTLYYDKEEYKKFEEALDKKLDSPFFNNLCDCFFELIEKGEVVKTQEEIRKVLIKMWPISTIFHEISLYPKWVCEEDLLRLNRIRKNTEDFSYKLSTNLKKEESPEKYYFFQGKVFEGKPEINCIGA
jgi:hypothetical protein